MLPALFAGVAGLRNHQDKMNIIGNNLANVNTVGFKYNRVTFTDLIYQNLRDASAPQNGNGGTNPLQSGLGSLLGSIDSILTQGNLQSTGQSTDLAIQGRGYFVVGDDTQTLYTRAGNTVVGVDGDLLNPSNGLKYKGWSATNGVVDTSGPTGNLNIPIGQELAATATSQVTFAGNLNASGNVALGTVASTGQLLAAAAGTDLLTSLKNSQGTNLGVQVGNVINITGNVGGTAISGQSLTVTASTTLANLATAVQTALRSVADGDLTETAAVQADGSILVTSDTTSDITNLQLGISGNSVFNNAHTYSTPISSGNNTAASNTLRAAATGTDTLVNMFDAAGNSLGLAAGDDLTLLSAVVKGVLVSNVSILNNITNGTTLENYRAGLQTAVFSAFPITGESIAIQSDGSLLISGAVGASNAVTGLDIGAGPNPSDDTRTVFGGSQITNESQAAADATNHRTTVQLFDSLGNTHNVTLTFTKTAGNVWSWTSDNNGSSVGSGVLNFDSAGDLLTSTGSISLTLANGAQSPLNVTMSFASAKQFAANSTLVTSSQDGNATATLSNFSLGAGGEIVGIFTNGKNELLGQMAMATFSNPGGLLRSGRNLLTESPNSGTPIIGAPGTDDRGSLVSGTLEMSNVDVAREFTDLIVTERGFQSNARVITTSDRLLEELVNIKR